MFGWYLICRNMSTDSVYFRKSIRSFRKHRSFVWIYSQLQIHTMLYVKSGLGCNNKIFLRGAKSFFLIFFRAWNAFFPVENFHFGTPKTNFSRFEKWKKKKKKNHPKQILAILKSEKGKKTKNKTKGPLLILELFLSSSPHFGTFPPSIFSFPPSLLLGIKPGVFNQCSLCQNSAKTCQNQTSW